MGLFTKKKLSDAERQAWSAQLLEVRAAELDQYGEGPTLGPTWEAHDAEYTRIWAEEYFPEYGYLAWSMMAADGLRSSSYRSIVPGEAMLMLESELEEPPSEWLPGGVYWVINTGKLDEYGEQIWGYQFVSASWSSLKSNLKAKVAEWDLENTRKTNQLWKDDFNRYFTWIAKALLTIATIIVLIPVIGGAALGIVLGEAINIGGFIKAATQAVTGSQFLAGANQRYEGATGYLDSMMPEVDSIFVDAPSQFNDESAVLLGEIAADPNGVPVFLEDGQMIMADNAPTGLPESGSGIVPLLVAAASYMIFI